MKWKLLFLLSLTGIFVGIITVYYLPARFEAVLTTPVFLLCAYFLAKYAEVAFFLHGFLLGILNSAFTTATHAIMAEKYFTNHPKEAVLFAKMSEESGAKPVQAMLLMGIFIALVSGIAMGMFAIAGSKILQAIKKEKGY